MKNLIDIEASMSGQVRPKKKLNKIKISMICILVLCLNGIYLTANAGDMLINKADTPSVAVIETHESALLSNNIPSEPIVTQIIPPSNIPVLNYGIVTSQYGSRKHPISGKVKPHRGLDLGLPAGTPVYAPASGTVIFSGWKQGYGFVIEIDHENGYLSLFAHNKINLVKLGTFVNNNTIIARVGATGIATGPHIHVEIIFHGKNVNPIQFFHSHSAVQPFHD